MFSFVRGNEKGLVVKTRTSCPTLRYDPPKIVVSDWKLPPMSEDKGQRCVLLRVLQKKIAKIGLPAYWKLRRSLVFWSIFLGFLVYEGRQRKGSWNSW
jgi:hypothetical protein